MRRRIAALVLSATALAAAGACSKSDTPATRCDPGTFVFCRCPDGEPGSHQCTDDGQSFSECVLQDTGDPCPDASTGGGGAGGMSSSSSAGGATSSSSSASTGGSGGAGGSGGGTTYGCPGAPLTVSLAMDTSVMGDNSLATDQAKGPCGGAGAPEIVYAVTPQGSGTLIATATGLGSDPVLYAVTSKCAGGDNLGCVDQTGSGGTEVLDVEALMGQVIYLFVDAHDMASAGPFSLNLHLTTAVPGDTCPGIPIGVDPGTDVMIAGDTSIATANYKGAGPCATSGSTKDIVYGVTPSADGVLTVLMSPAFDGQLYARSGTCTAAGDLACSETAGVGGVEQITFPVVANTKYSVFADGNSGSAGAYTMTFHLQ